MAAKLRNKTFSWYLTNKYCVYYIIRVVKLAGFRPLYEIPARDEYNTRYTFRLLVLNLYTIFVENYIPTITY